MKWKIVLAGVFLLCLLLAGIKSESLWIDEGDTAYYAIEPTFSAWKTHLLTDTNADCQFPLYMFGIWVWEKGMGASEYALRSLNVGFALLTLASLALIGRELRLRYLWALLLIQPFFWFYLNEARPYMLQIASGSVLLAGFVLLAESQRKRLGWVLFFTGTVLLYYSTLLSFVTLGVFYAALGLLVWRKQVALPKKWGWWLLLMGVLIAPGSLYYLHTIARGAGGARIWAVSPLNFVWVVDEIIGGVGLGPPVWKIRETARSFLQSGMTIGSMEPFIPAVILAGTITGTFFLAALKLRHRYRLSRLYEIFVGMVFLIVLSFAALSILLKKAFWARHLSPIFPVYVLLLYGALHVLTSQQKSLFHRSLVVLTVILLTLSSLQLVFSEIHSRDDYRGAAHRAMTTLQQTGSVWWAGSWHCGAYYGLPIFEGMSTSSHLFLIQDPSDAKLLSLPTPDLILLSRPDVYDGENRVKTYALENGFKPDQDIPHLFKVWERK